MKLVEAIEWEVHHRQFPDSVMLYGRVKVPGFIRGTGLAVDAAAAADEWLMAARLITREIEQAYLEVRATFAMFEVDDPCSTLTS